MKRPVNVHKSSFAHCESMALANWYDETGLATHDVARGAIELLEDTVRDIERLPPERRSERTMSLSVTSRVNLLRVRTEVREVNLDRSELGALTPGVGEVAHGARTRRSADDVQHP